MENQLSALDHFNIVSNQISIVCLVIGVAIILFHLLKVMVTQDPKTKYDYLNSYEVRLLGYSSIMFIVAAVFQIQLLFPVLNISQLTFIIIRLAVIGMIGVAIGYFIWQYLSISYPGKLEKRLEALRYKPRISPKTGKPMKLLSEEEEDVHLTEGMQAEENVFSIDYDVWIDEETGYTKIEKYDGHLHASKCPDCGFQTLKDVREEIVKSPSLTETGELIKHYDCSFCGHKEMERVTIAILEKEAVEKTDNESITTA
jgi:DNA-directed RNA polymerase subunit RPC12/RpoP